MIFGMIATMFSRISGNIEPNASSIALAIVNNASIKSGVALRTSLSTVGMISLHLLINCTGKSVITEIISGSFELIPSNSANIKSAPMLSTVGAAFVIVSIIESIRPLIPSVTFSLPPSIPFTISRIPSVTKVK